MTYVIIVSEDGRTWFLLGGDKMASEDRDAVLAELTAQQREHPESQYAVKALDTQLWLAFQCSFICALYPPGDDEG